MLSCKEITELCTAFEEGALSWTQWAQFRMHLILCPVCMDYVNQMRMTAETLRNLEGPAEIPAPDREELSRRFRAWHDETHR